MTEKLHIGDNLDFMRSLESESIDLIYGDILYGTGRDFGDYQDLKANRKDVEDFYIPRIIEMHRLLKQTGSIYLQMDTRINHWLRIILDDIFGNKNFRNSIIYQKRSTANNIKTFYFTKNHDVILFYRKSKKYKFNIKYRELSIEARKRYSKIDKKRGRYQMQTLHVNKYNKERELKFNDKKYIGNYIWSQKTLDQRIKEGAIIKINSIGHLSYATFLNENKGVQLSDIWTDLQNEKTNDFYETQKSLELMSRIIKASSDENDTIADFFAGSGSFVVAGKKLNRNIIACDINSKAIEITKKRLRNENNLFNQ